MIYNIYVIMIYIYGRCVMICWCKLVDLSCFFRRNVSVSDMVHFQGTSRPLFGGVILEKPFIRVIIVQTICQRCPSLRGFVSAIQSSFVRWGMFCGSFTLVVFYLVFALGACCRISRGTIYSPQIAFKYILKKAWLRSTFCCCCCC